MTDISEQKSSAEEVPMSSQNVVESKQHGIELTEQPTNSTSTTSNSRFGSLYKIVTYTPKRCRYDPSKPPGFSMGLNILFAFAACFTVANLYYNHPILNLLANDFHITDEEASRVPTLCQAGYATGLALLCPLGDLVKRRAFVLWLVWFTATLWIVLCVTKSYHVFLAVSFLTSVTTVTPQLMLPLVGDLAPPNRRALALSIVVSGLLFGMLIARFLSGVVAFIIGWRYIYWISFALQYLILILLYLFMPDYPSTNPETSMVRGYPKLLWHIVKMPFQHPVLAQACLIGFCTSTTFTAFWTTLTFLLAGEPYHYSSLVIGLFALLGLAAISWGPIFARTVMDKTVPLFSVIVGGLICLVSIVIGTYTGTFTVAGPIIQALGQDIGIQTSQIANRTAIYSTAPKARNRVNTSYMVMVFLGQTAGTLIGNRLYAAGGWHVSGSASVGFICLALLFSVVRGPRETGWIGWSGGWRIWKDPPVPVVKDEETQAGSGKGEAGVSEDREGDQAGLEPERTTEKEAENAR